MSRRCTAALLALLTACGGSDSDGQPQPGAPAAARVTVMTRNLFLGSGLDALFTPAAALNPPAAVRTLYEEVKASDPAARMDRVASEIAERRPELVGLQEAAIFASLTPPALSEVVEHDFVELIVAALRTRGLDYRLVSATTNFDQPFLDDSGRIVHFTDRDAILARGDVATRDPADGHFPTVLSVPFNLLSVTVPRGWCAITADVAGTTVRFVNTHLEAVSAPTREAQARELVALLAPETRPAVLVGDFNSPPLESAGAYGIVRGGGWADPWDALRPTDPGLTCCFETDLRTADALETRIDLVLLRGPFTPESAEVVGEEPADRTASLLWPSDHAGVVVAALRP